MTQYTTTLIIDPLIKNGLLQTTDAKIIAQQYLNNGLKSGLFDIKNLITIYTQTDRLAQLEWFEQIAKYEEVNLELSESFPIFQKRNERGRQLMQNGEPITHEDKKVTFTFSFVFSRSDGYTEMLITDPKRKIYFTRNVKDFHNCIDYRNDAGFQKIFNISYMKAEGGIEITEMKDITEGKQQNAHVDHSNKKEGTIEISVASTDFQNQKEISDKGRQWLKILKSIDSEMCNATKLHLMCATVPDDESLKVAMRDDRHFDLDAISGPFKLSPSGYLMRKGKNETSETWSVLKVNQLPVDVSAVITVVHKIGNYETRAVIDLTNKRSFTTAASEIHTETTAVVYVNKTGVDNDENMKLSKLGRTRKMSDSEESLINPPTPGRYPHNDDDYSPDSFDEFEPQATSTAVNKPVDYVEVQTIHGAEAEQDNAKGSEVHAAANDDSEVKKIDENVEGENDEDEEEETSDDVKEKKNVEDSVEVEKADVDDDKEYQKYLEWKRNQKKNLHKNRNSNMTDTSFTCPTAPEKDPRDDRVESLEDSEKGKDDCELIEEGKGEDIADRTEKDGEKRGAKRKGGDDDTGSVLKKSKTLVDVLDDANVVQKQKEDEMREFLEELDFGEQAEVKTVNRKLSLHHFLNMQLHGQLLRQVSSEKITDMSAKVCASIDGVKALFDVDLINSRPHILISEDCDEEHPEQGIVSDGNHRAIAVLNSCQHLLEQGDMEIDVVLVKLNPTNFASLFQLSRSLRPEDQRHADGVWNANKTNLSKVDSGTRRIIMKLYYDEVSRSKGAFSLYDNTVVLVEIFRGLIRDSDCIDLIRRSPSKRNAFYRKITELGLAPTASSSEGHIKEAFMLSVMRTLTRKVYLHHLSEGFNFWTADKSTEILLKASISNDKLTSEQLQNCVKKKMSGARVRQILQAIIAASKRQEENVNEAVETETHAPDVNVPFPLSSMATVVTTVSEVKNESCLVCIGQFPENILEVVKRRITVVVLDIHGSILNIDQKLAKYTNIGTVKRSAYCEGTGTAPYMICSLNLDKDKCVKFCKNTATTIVSIINKNTGHSKDKKKAFCEIFAVPKYCGSEDD